MKVLAIEQGIVYKGGKVIPWKVVFEMLNEALDAKTYREVQQKIYDTIIVHQTKLITDTTEVAELLGVKEGVSLPARIEKKVRFLNKKVEDDFGRFEAKPIAGSGQVGRSTSRARKQDGG